MIDSLFGLNSENLITPEPWRSPMQPGLVAPLNALAEEAGKAGFQLQVASGFRSFERQLAIWNAKACGQRPVLDSASRPLDVETLSEHELVYAILRWSALPGCSRHHWGTDLDVYDGSRLPSGYKLQLTLEETRGDGVCAPFHTWLNDYLQSAQNPGFFRPYDRDRGGVAPEPWHLSFAPLSRPYEQQLTPETLRPVLAESELQLKSKVLECLDDIFERFVRLGD